jgi:hypothetical protein
VFRYDVQISYNCILYICILIPNSKRKPKKRGREARGEVKGEIMTMTRKRALTTRQNQNRSGLAVNSSSSTRFGNDETDTVSSSTNTDYNNCAVCDRKSSYDSSSSSYLPCGGCYCYRYNTIIQQKRRVKQQQQQQRPPKMQMITSTIVIHFFTKTIPIFLTFVIISLTVPKLLFDIARYSTMSRPAFIYGTPTDFNDIKGCLSSTYRQEVRDYLNLNLNPSRTRTTTTTTTIQNADDVIWNWNRYSSNNPLSSSSSSSSSLSSYDTDSVMSGGVNNNTTSNTTTTTTTSKTPRRRLLIAQYSGKGSYLRLLREVEPINKAYAKRWGHDYTTLVGTALKFPGLIYDHDNSNNNSNNKINGDNNQYCRYYNSNNNSNSNINSNSNNSNSNSNNISSSSSSSRNHTTMTSSTTPSQQQYNYNYEAQSTFNKIPLLFKAMDEFPQKYDQVLILDTDTMIVDFDFDITSLMFSKSKTKSKSNNNKNDDNLFYRGSNVNVNENTNNNIGDENAFDTTSRNDVKEEDYVNDSDNNNSSVVDSDQNNNNMNDSNTTNKNNNNNNAINDDDDETSNFLVAYRVWSLDPNDTWDVNAGITLWNLRHPKTRIVAEDWLKRSLSHPKDVLLKNDDQYYLQRSLQKVTTATTTRSTTAGSSSSRNSNTNDTSFGLIKSVWYWWKRHSFLPLVLNYYYRLRGGDSSGGTYSTISGDGSSGIRAIRKEFEYYNASVIKHFKRDTASWTRTGLEQRLMRIKETKIDICKRWQC